MCALASTHTDISYLRQLVAVTVAGLGCKLQHSQLRTCYKGEDVWTRAKGSSSTIHSHPEQQDCVTLNLTLATQTDAVTRRCTFAQFNFLNLVFFLLTLCTPLVVRKPRHYTRISRISGWTNPRSKHLNFFFGQNLHPLSQN